VSTICFHSGRLARGREQRLDVIERGVEAHVDVALVDALDPVHRALVGVHRRQLALGVVQGSGPSMLVQICTL
jgi:hypothetical protein